MENNAKIYVAGHRGLVGSAIMRQLHAQGYTNTVTRTHAELDLTNQLTLNSFPIVNIGCGKDQTIQELAERIKQAIGFKGGLRFNSTKPDGTPRKQLDVSLINGLVWQARTELKDVIAQTYAVVSKESWCA